MFPQGAGAIYAYNIEGDVLLLDIGGYTIDIAMFENRHGKSQLVKYNTLYKGVISLYSEIIGEANKKYDLSLDVDYGEKILSNGLSIFGEKQDLSWLKPIFENYVDDIMNNLKLNYPYSTLDIYLCGGGAYVLSNAFKRQIKNVSMLGGGQFANAKGFKRLGDSACPKMITRGVGIR